MDSASSSDSELAPLVRKLRSLTDLTVGEQHAIENLTVTTCTLQARSEVVHARDCPLQCCIVLDGWACRYRMLRGLRRKILSLHVPGDVPDLQSLHLPVVDHAVATLTRSRVAYISHENLYGLVLRFPRLGAALWRITLLDAAIAREWMSGMGRRSAYQRVAHLLCELYLRLKAVGLAGDNSYSLPPTQRELSDAVGLSPNQFNRTLQDLRQRGLIAFQDYVLAINDLRGLSEAGEFNPSYLHLQGRMAT